MLPVFLVAIFVGIVAADTTTTAAPVQVSIGSDAIGYVLTIAAGVMLITLYGVYYVFRLIRCNMLKDNKIYLPDERMTQRGFVSSRFGTLLRLLTYLFALWLQTVMLMVVIGHYNDQWPFDLSRPPGSVDWASFTRVFLAAWIASIALAITARFLQGRMESFYLRPAPLGTATHVKLSAVVADLDDPEHELSVQHEEVLLVERSPARHVDFLLKRFVWSSKEGMFVAGKFFGRNGPRRSELEALSRVGGMSLASVLDRMIAFGRNEITLNINSLGKMLVDELLTFFYIYQISVCWLPLYWDYVTAGLLLLLIILTSAVIKVVMERREKVGMHSLATLHGDVWAKRDTHWTKLMSEEVVVGDIICVSRDGPEMLADCILITGYAVMDESSLSGETMPVQKVQIDTQNNEPISPEEIENRKNYIFAGTTLLQADGAPALDLPSSVACGALAIVTATGPNTLRGQLIRSLVFGSHLQSPFAAELGVALTILVGLAMVNFAIINTVYVMSAASVLPAIVSIVGLINPLLSVALLGGELRAAKRLQAKNVHTRDVHRLTVAGKVNVVFLDKTGTITKSGLDFRGIVPANSLRLIECKDRTAPVPMEQSACLAMAHSISKCNGALIGHQVELGMVEAAKKIGWNFEPDLRSPVDPFGNAWEVERVFPFSHESMTMSAIIAQKQSKRFVVCKGSVEALKRRCVSVSDDILKSAEAFAQEGCYVLGIASKELGEGTINREEAEAELDFLGLFLFRNEIKDDSEKYISEIAKAGIDCRMLTGDSVFTASFVARAVGLIPATWRVVLGVLDPKSQLVEWRLADTDSLISEESVAGDNKVAMCITGEVYKALRIAGKLDTVRTRVFARVSPNQKAEIVKLFINDDKIVAMCGDGGNDSGALRAAHAGLALNGKAEATVAAPFSTSSDSLGTLVELIRDSRTALCTSLASYRFLIAVGIIQTFTKVVLFMQYGGYLSGVASLFIDCIIVPLMLFAISSALPAQTSLAKSPPEGSLLGPEMILGTIWTLAVGFVFLGILEGVMEDSDWFVPFTTDAPLNDWRMRADSFEAELIVLFRFWLYVDVGIVYSYGSLHRQSVWKNWRLVLLSLLLFGVVTALIFGPPSSFNCAFMVNCSASANEAAANCWINAILFYYERIGGTWYGVVDSIEYPMDFKVTVFALLIAMSLVHHIGFRLAILGPVTNWFHKIGWTDGLSCCACCRRRKHGGGYVPLELSIKADLLNESILSAAEESPAAEWELRRTYGKWRAPMETEYN